jgi:DNA-binding XRE family transcriptional regulator
VMAPTSLAAEQLVVGCALNPTGFLDVGTRPVDRIVRNLKAARVDLGLTQAELARLTGRSVGMIGRLERGECRYWYLALRVRAALTLLELSAPLDELDLVVERVDRAISHALDQPTCTSCGEAT